MIQSELANNAPAQKAVEAQNQPVQQAQVQQPKQLGEQMNDTSSSFLSNVFKASPAGMIAGLITGDSRKDVGDIVAGGVRGAGSIGSTLYEATPIGTAQRMLNGKGFLESRKNRVDAIDDVSRNLGADTDSIGYGAGKVGAEIAGTAGVGGMLGKVAQAMGAAPKIANALSSGGFTLGVPSATTKLGTAANAALRTGAGAVTGGSAAGMVNPEEAGTGALIGAAMPGAVKIAGELGKATGSVVKNAIGSTTGTSAETLSAAYQAGKRGSQDFINNMRGNAEFDDVVDAAKSGLAKMRQARAEQYRSGMVDISKDKTVIDFSPIEDAVKKIKSIGNYKGVQINKNASGVVDEIEQTVSNWKSLNPAEYHTPEGLDALKRAIGDIRDTTQFGTSARKAVDEVYNSIKSEISSQAPTYSRVMKDYSSASNTLDEITKSLSLGDKASKDTAIRKLQSLMRNNAQTNYGNRLSLAKQLEEAGNVNITDSIAGQAMNTWAPRGMVGAMQKAGAAGLAGASFYNPALLAGAAVAPFASPRLMGESAYLLGRMSGGVGNASKAVTPSSEEARKMLADTLRVSPVIGLLGNPASQR